MSAAGLQHRARILRVREQPGGPGEPLETFFDNPELPDGVFCWSDIHAMEIMNSAYQRGIAVPERLSVVGYDNTPAAAMPLVGLSSVEQRGGSLGRIAAKALLTRLAGRHEAEHVLVEPELVVRRSLRTEP
jgi:LacI family transcriptional regulator